MPAVEGGTGGGEGIAATPAHDGAIMQGQVVSAWMCRQWRRRRRVDVCLQGAATGGGHTWPASKPLIDNIANDHRHYGDAQPGCHRPEECNDGHEEVQGR